ncbi:MAG: hypothetical protein ACE5NM_13750 [Sedimentisphaerales bacterium]
MVDDKICASGQALRCRGEDARKTSEAPGVGERSEHDGAVDYPKIESNFHQ